MFCSLHLAVSIMARITSRDNKHFVSHGFCHRARPSLRFRGTRRFVICFGREVKGQSIACSADACLCGLFHGRRGQQLYTLRCIFVTRDTSRDYKRSSFLVTVRITVTVTVYDTVTHARPQQAAAPNSGSHFLVPCQSR